MSLREVFQLSLENHPTDTVDDDSVDNPLVDGFEPERSVIFHGNIRSGEWETILQESYKPFKVWNLLNGMGSTVAQPSLETIQLQEQALDLTEAAMSNATQVYVLPESDLGLAVQEEFLTAAMNSPENSVVVAESPSDDLRASLRDQGITVVASLEDAALYIATAC